MTEALKKFAETDLRAARREGSHLVARTKLGNLTIYYEGRNYRIVVNGLEPRQIYNGPKAGAIETLVNAYDVQPATKLSKTFNSLPDAFPGLVDW